MTIKFGRFQVLPHRREFFADGVPVPLGSRAFDVLMVLIEAGGDLETTEAIANELIGDDSPLCLQVLELGRPFRSA